VTFLFTDIEGSTRLWESAPASMQEALEAHDRIVRNAVDVQAHATPPP
jgi:class 3 adenylate cyclase